MASSNQERTYCIIGAGPSGLAMAAAFRAQGIAYDHFERHEGLGGLWDIERAETPLYDSAHFISSRTMSAFSGFPMPEDYPDYPSHRQILSYLRAFARHHGIDEGIRFGTTVDRVVPEEGSATVTIAGRERRYRGVICASGVNWDPVVPDIPGTFAGECRHAMSYRNPREFEGRRVLIVGLGNSGADIACDAARSAESAAVSVRRGYYFIPKHILGKPADVFAKGGPRLPLWLERPAFSLLMRLLVGDVQRLGMPKPDHAILESHPLMNDQLLHHLRHGDVELVGDVASFDGHDAVFRDGTRRPFDLVLFATGYTRRIPYLEPEYLDTDSWAAGQFLTCISRRFDSLFTLGFAELNGALYPHLSRLAELASALAALDLDDPLGAKSFRDWARATDFDLTGGRHLIHTPRHANYCDDHALEHACRKALQKLGSKPHQLAPVRAAELGPARS